MHAYLLSTNFEIFNDRNNFRILPYNFFIYLPPAKFLSFPMFILRLLGWKARSRLREKEVTRISLCASLNENWNDYWSIFYFPHKLFVPIWLSKFWIAVRNGVTRPFIKVPCDTFAIFKCNRNGCNNAHILQFLSGTTDRIHECFIFSDDRM